MHIRYWQNWMDVIGDIVDKEKKPILLYAIN